MQAVVEYIHVSSGGNHILLICQTGICPTDLKEADILIRKPITNTQLNLKHYFYRITNRV